MFISQLAESPFEWGIIVYCNNCFCFEYVASQVKSTLIYWAAFSSNLL